MGASTMSKLAGVGSPWGRDFKSTRRLVSVIQSSVWPARTAEPFVGVDVIILRRTRRRHNRGLYWQSGRRLPLKRSLALVALITAAFLQPALAQPGKGHGNDKGQG